MSRSRSRLFGLCPEPEPEPIFFEGSEPEPEPIFSEGSEPEPFFLEGPEPEPEKNRRLRNSVSNPMFFGVGSSFSMVKWQSEVQLSGKSGFSRKKSGIIKMHIICLILCFLGWGVRLKHIIR